MTDIEIVALTVARVREEVEAKVGPIQDEGSVWGRATMKALKDVKDARDLKHEEAKERARCPDCKCQLDFLSGVGAHLTLCPRFPL